MYSASTTRRNIEKKVERKTPLSHPKTLRLCQANGGKLLDNLVAVAVDVGVRKEDQVGLFQWLLGQRAHLAVV